MATTVVVTKRGKLQNEVTAQTPGSIPNVLVKPMSIMARVAIKAGKVYFSSIIGFLGAGALMTATNTSSMPLGHGMDIIWNAAQLAVYPTLVNIIINFGTLFSKLDEKYPELMA